MRKTILKTIERKPLNEVLFKLFGDNMQTVSKIGLLLILGTLLIKPSFAQEANQVIPPSPEASAFQKYGEYPVDMHYGRPNISIPLYEIKGKELSFPISINYNTTGIKVQEMASNIGLGWVLNAGGCVSANIRGGSDISHPNGFMENGKQTLTDMSYHIARMTFVHQDYDTESDIYFFNFNNKSGKFFWGGEGPTDVIFSPKYSSLKVEYKLIEGVQSPDKYTRQGFEITDESGVKYQFGIAEWTTKHTAPGETVHYPSAWFLTKILSPNRTDSICFNYSFYQNQVVSYSYYGLNRIAIGHPRLTMSGPDVFDQTRNEHVTDYETWALDSITFSNGTMTFEHDNYREDFIRNEGLKYNTIKIFDTQNELIHKIDFNYSYFLSYEGGNCEHHEKRLKLNSLNIADAKDTETKTYSFAYNSKPLPSRYSMKQDYWGYYNDGSESVILPRSRILPDLSYADRSSSPEFMQAAILKEIKYPTGGTTSFDFEPHQFTSEVYGKDEIFTFTHSPMLCDDYNTTLQTAGTTLINIKIDFPIIPDDIFDGQNNIQLVKVNGFATNGDAELIEISNGLLGDFYHSILSDDFVSNSIIAEAEISENAIINILLKAICINGDAYWPRVTISYNNSNYAGTETKILGGLRISKISSKDLVTSEPLVKTYKYSGEKYIYGEGNQRFEYTSIYYYTYREYSESAPRLGHTEVLYRSDKNLRDDGASNSPICYAQVEEIIGDNNSNLGKTVTEYTFESNTAILIGSNVNIPSQDNSVFRGKPYRVTYYDKDNNIVNQTTNYYRVALMDESRGAICSETIMNVIALLQFVSSEEYLDNKYRYDFYPIESHKVYLDSTVTLENLDGNWVKSKSAFEYMPNYPYLQNGETVNTSAGKITETKIIFPSDINSGIYPLMSQAKMLNYPIEQTSMVDGKITQAKLSTYKSQDGKILPDRIFLLEVTDPLHSFSLFDGLTWDGNYGSIPEVNFLEYSSDGRIIKSFGKDGIYNYYLWGYNNQYPVAKIATNSDALNISSIQQCISGLSFSYSDNLDDINTDIGLLQSCLAPINNTQNYVSYYTYKPLVGFTSQTDPNGLTTYFEYDGLGRLIKVMDHNYNIIKDIMYKYKVE